MKLSRDQKVRTVMTLICEKNSIRPKLKKIKDYEFQAYYIEVLTRLRHIVRKMMKTI